MALHLRHVSPSLRISQCPHHFSNRPVLHRAETSFSLNHSTRAGTTQRRIIYAAAESETSSSQAVRAEPSEKEWIALVANAEFMLLDVQNESLAEQLRERVRHFGEKGREIDFFLVPEPKWLESKYPEKAKLVGRPCVALISNDHVWMRFMKTRLDQVLEIRLGSMLKEEAVEAGGEIPDFDNPKIWRAPYSPYTPGWWEAFYPKKETNTEEDES